MVAFQLMRKKRRDGVRQMLISRVKDSLPPGEGGGGAGHQRFRPKLFQNIWISRKLGCIGHLLANDVVKRQFRGERGGGRESVCAKRYEMRGRVRRPASGSGTDIPS